MANDHTRPLARRADLRRRHPRRVPRPDHRRHRPLRHRSHDHLSDEREVRRRTSRRGGHAVGFQLPQLQLLQRRGAETQRTAAETKLRSRNEPDFFVESRSGCLVAASYASAPMRDFPSGSHEKPSARCATEPGLRGFPSSASPRLCVEQFAVSSCGKPPDRSGRIRLTGVSETAPARSGNRA